MIALVGRPTPGLGSRVAFRVGLVVAFVAAAFSGGRLALRFPIRHPGIHRQRCLLPIGGERARIWIFSRVCAEALTDRIHPDVSGDAFGIVSIPEDVIVEFLLPEHAVIFEIEFVSGFLF